MKKSLGFSNFHTSTEIRIALLAFFVFLWVYMLLAALHPQHKSCSLTFGQNDTEAVYAEFSKHPTKRWFDAGNPLQGAQFDGIIHNNTNGEIQNWTIQIELPEESYVESYWNGKFGIEKGLLTVIVDKTEDSHIVFPHENRTFGCIMYTEEDYVPQRYTINYSIKKSLRKSKVFALLALVTFAYLVYLITSSIYIFKIKMLKREEKLNRKMIEQSLRLFANTIEIKDEYTKGHSQRVSQYAKKLAEKMNLQRKQIEVIYYAAILHDIGKIIIPNTILNKKTPLTPEEKEIMNSHVVISYEILKDFTAVEGIAKIVRHHHENFDGSGYPDKLKGEEIPLETRILTIADSFDAMTTSRGYNVAMTKAQAINDLERYSGIKYDPEILNVFIQLLKSDYF